jgi:fibronectin-binding autotransporter adhesin
VLGDGRYEVLASDTIGSLAGEVAATVLLSGGETLTTGFDNTDTTFAGVIEGGGALEKIGAGTFTLTNTNTYTGGTTISGGGLSLGGGLGGSDLGSVEGDITNESLLIFNRSNAYAFTAVVSGDGAVHHDGDGTTTLSANQPYTGDTVINAGRFQVTATLADLTGVTVNAGGVYDVDTTDTIRLLQGAGDVELADGIVLTAGDSSDTVVSGVISGEGGFKKVGSGRQTLSGQNTYQGNTIIAAGVLQVDGSLADETAVSLIASNTRYAVNSTDTIGSLEGVAGTSVVIGDSFTLTTGGLDTDTEFAGVISGDGGLRKVGSGSFTLTAANAYHGATSVDEGSLVVKGTLSDQTPDRS